MNKKKYLILIVLLIITTLFYSNFLFAIENNQPMIGVALSGGAARGLAHIGFLEVLNDNNININAIAGTSSGAIIGGLYATGNSTEEIINIVSDINWLFYLRPTLSDLGFFSTNGIEVLLEKNLKTTNFSDLNIPLAVVASDFETGEEVVIKEGSLIKALCASAAIPVIFKPVNYMGKLLVDGGLVNHLPVSLLKEMNVDIIIAVDVSGSFNFTKTPTNKIETGIRAYNIMQKNNKKTNNADILIQVDLDEFDSIDFHYYLEIIEKGRQATKEVLPKIKELLDLN